MNPTGSIGRTGFRTNASGAFCLSNDSHVTVGLERECVPAGAGGGWFASYSASKSSTWKAK
ncbi:MAG TPA: hypothetical protein DGH68_06815 [Bacteroidetes bacterium]|nr:hypothetical protein [Bacteroidota bacterium]